MSNIKITVPIDMRELANRISRSLEPDSGGYHVFDFQTDDPEAPTVAIAEIPSCERYVTNLLALYQDPDALHAFIADDYAARWPDFTAPTMGECGAFCAVVVVDIDAG